MTKREVTTPDQTGRDALIAYYDRVSPPVRQSFRRWRWRAVGAVGLTAFLWLAGNTVTSGGDNDPSAGRGDDGGYSDTNTGRGNTGEGSSATGEGTVPSQPSKAETNLTCKLSSLNALKFAGSGTRKVVLGLTVTGADITSPNTQVVAPLVHEGAIAPGGGGSVLLNPDGSRTAEVPGDSRAVDVYGVYVSAGGSEVSCGGFYFNDPTDSSAHFVDDDQLPAHP